MSDKSTLNGYYNSYDPTKNYNEMLFRAGKVLQSQELNELQSMVKNQIKNVGDTVLTNGDIIEGCQLVIIDKQVTLTKGRIYLNGNVHPVKDTTFTIKGKGIEVIGAILKSKVVSSDQDESMLDKAAGYDNYHQDGAFRLQEYVEIVINNPTSSTLYTLIDGQQLTINTNEDLTQLDKINATLARRTFDESGNYKVSGLTLVEKDHFDDTSIYISLEPGKAYVRGYEVSKSTATTVALQKPNILRQIDNEPKTYRTGEVEYKLNNPYVNTINKVVCIVGAIQQITRGSIVGGTDYLPLTPVAEVIHVKQGGTIYNKGVDYQLSEDGIDWSIGSRAPNPGTSYEVSWTYNKTMSKGSDYNLVKREEIGYINFLSGDRPINGSTFLINYDFTLCRRDTISLDKDGKVIVTQGQADILRTVESPSVGDENVLVLGSVLLIPNSNKVAIINNNTKTIPMLDLYKMLKRLNDLEYNQAISDLDKEAAEGENATQLMGVFTDGFIGLSKADTYHSQWDASIDLDNKELTLPFETTIQNLVINKTQNYNVGTFGRILTAPYSEVLLFTQPLATNNIRINSYNAFPKTPIVTLSPEIDNWVDERHATIQGETKNSSKIVRRWWYHKGELWAQEENNEWKNYGKTDTTDGKTSTQKSAISSVLDTAILYMRPNTITVTVQNLRPNADNVIALFDDRPINLTPLNGTYQGTQAGSLRADSTGTVKGTFRIPDKTLCGTRSLKVFEKSVPSLFGVGNYTSNGRIRTTTKTVWTETVQLRASDPLAQSFQFEQDQYLTGVGIYFNDKDNVEPTIIQVRNMVNGYPGTTVYTEKVIYPNQITPSNNASLETKVVFDNPVYCNALEQYCFTILSNSDVDSVWIAETTKIDTLTGQHITKNPYLNGTLFSSSNALTWTAHQSADLKFKLYGAQFQQQGSCEFNLINGVQLDRLMVMSEESIPSGCSVSWQYSINNGDWLPIETHADRELLDVAENVKVRLQLKAYTNTSPAIATDSLLLCGFSNKLKGVYVSKNVGVTDGFNNIKVVVDMAVPANTNITVSVATDTSGTSWTTLSNTSTVQKTHQYKTYTFEKSISKATNYRVKIEMTTVNKTSRPKVQNLRSIMKTV